MTYTTELETKLYEAYDVGYQVFLQNWLINRQVALDLIAKYFQPRPPQVAVLSVGAGPGDFDVQVIRFLQQQLPKDFTLRYLAVEPNPLHRQRYEQKINTSEFSDVELKVYPINVQEFQTDEKFDIIHYTHCLYHMPNDEKQIIRQGLEMLKEDGFLVITLDTREAVMFETIFKYAALTGQGFADMLQMEQMQTIVEELGLLYELVNYPEYMDVHLCFEQASPGSKALLDFFCQADSGILTPQQREEILGLLASKVNQQDGRELVSLPSATMIIPKQIVNNPD
ncbi:MAG: class I SAM-dependent methyltransferase [Oscillatoria sp. PMC 1051.18]|uniref:class I SAM-dependent methyltransferase n=1 Tax=Oscillatoria salina TaxID=331517 RepID=UPI0013BA4C6D|nr:class I SAM-dependent methyltransferase [Oscillatoria salina]MBZ8183074.1 class I SAM-dependent methyltransferase [Oscillatoria salina IIICB1]MEC4894162.1 class I SAM-dependent methyltransferase [Oscillatoria sp. PMC 1050.18]MEC5030914.1 class I SAM-dependent methyltransferase [Oscillatoria sp. PMC 1051.18]NET91276.1 class I SAM-dependent methyltransferase [Kamptonema sp. SIO1D9]